MNKYILLKFFEENSFVMRIYCKHYMTARALLRATYNAAKFFFFKIRKFQDFYQNFDTESFHFMQILLKLIFKDFRVSVI